MHKNENQNKQTKKPIRKPLKQHATKKSQNTTKIILSWPTTPGNGACPEGKDIHSETPLKKTDLLFVSEDRLQIVSCLGL